MSDGWIERKPTPSEELGRMDEAVRDLTQQLAAERKRREAQEESANFHAETVLMAGERLGMTSVGREGLVANIGAIIARAEQAEGQQRSDFAKMQEWRARAERAEADNAALLTAIQQARTNLLYCTSTTPENLRRDVLHCLDPAAKADHPGAAMLELASLVLNYQHKDEATLADTFQRLMNERSRIATMVSPEIHAAMLERMRALEQHLRTLTSEGYSFSDVEAARSALKPETK